jgi:hypothetical protein
MMKKYLATFALSALVWPPVAKRKSHRQRHRLLRRLPVHRPPHQLLLKKKC